MAITGGFSKFDAAFRALDAMASQEVFVGILHAVGAELVHLIDVEFRESKDPDGNNWLKLKRPRKRGSGQPLRDTGRLMGSFNYQLQAYSLRVGTNVAYAPYHQFGTAGRNFVADHRRYQPVDGGGKFLSKKKASKRKAGAIAFRELNFQAGGGKIPARPFLPLDRPLPPRWEASVNVSVRTSLEPLLRALKAAS